jgi:hypothetical protein
LDAEGADQAMIRIMNDLRELAGFGFIEENGGER